MPGIHVGLALTFSTFKSTLAYLHIVNCIKYVSAFRPFFPFSIYLLNCSYQVKYLYERRKKILSNLIPGRAGTYNAYTKSSKHTVFFCCYFEYSI